MIDHESPLATVGLSKSDKEIKDADKADQNDEVCHLILLIIANLHQCFFTAY